MGQQPRRAVEWRGQLRQVLREGPSSWTEDKWRAGSARSPEERGAGHGRLSPASGPPTPRSALWVRPASLLRAQAEPGWGVWPLSREPGAERGRDPARPGGKSQTRRWPLRGPQPREGHFLQAGSEAGQRKGLRWWASVAWEPPVLAANGVSHAAARSLPGGGGQEGPGFPCSLILSPREQEGTGDRPGHRSPPTPTWMVSPGKALGPAHGLTAPLETALRVWALPAPDRGGDSLRLEEVAGPQPCRKRPGPSVRIRHH